MGRLFVDLEQSLVSISLVMRSYGPRNKYSSVAALLLLIGLGCSLPLLLDHEIYWRAWQSF